MNLDRAELIADILGERGEIIAANCMRELVREVRLLGQKAETMGACQTPTVLPDGLLRRQPANPLEPRW